MIVLNYLAPPTGYRTHFDVGTGYLLIAKKKKTFCGGNCRRCLASIFIIGTKGCRHYLVKKNYSKAICWGKKLVELGKKDGIRNTG